MSQQVTNFPHAIRTLLFNNWSLKDELVKEKIFWASYKAKPSVLDDQPVSITIEEISGVGDAQSLKHTKIDTLFKLDLYIKINAEDNDAGRIKFENTRALIKNEIMSIIHNNQTAITGIKIAVFGRMLTADEVEKGPTYLHNTIFISGQWWHIKQ